MSRPVETEFGIKKLSSRNWRERDPATQAFGRHRHGGSISELTDEDWLHSILSVELSDQVPQQVRKLFAVARGAMLYGYYFYPLLTLGSEQLYRVHEAALRHKYLQMFPDGRNEETFFKMVDRLSGRGLFDATRLRQWNAVRELRNFSSHADSQNIYPPSWAFGTIELASELIEELFRPAAT